jgi:glutamate carboxypeptidase
MDSQEKRLLEYFEAHEGEILADLTELVKADSPSKNKELSEQCADVLEGIVRKRLPKGSVTCYPQDELGRHIFYQSPGSKPDKIAITAHYDTVWEKGQLPEIHREGNRLHGPGILDMKSGAISAIWVLKAFNDLGIEAPNQYNIFFTSDEELSGPTSRPLMSKIFKGYKAAIIAEPGESQTGRYATRSYGRYVYDIEVTGVAAHAGANHSEGRNAIEELARHILTIQTLTDYEKQVVLNVGLISGGDKVNIVAPWAKCQVDCRFSTMKEGQRVYDIITNLKPYNPDCKIKVTAGTHLKPVERTDEIDTLYSRLKEAGVACDYEIDEFLWGACSDANYIFMIGIPTLCGLGAKGDGIHNENEHIYLDDYLPRMTVFASFLTRI